MSEILSALSDGQASSAEAAQASAQWRDDPQTRAAWHRYQLIGDALRSPELLQATEGARFLQGFRARLAQEPVVLAPQHAAVAAVATVGAAAKLAATPVQVDASLRRRPWAGPAAVAASFVLLVGLMASNLSGFQGGVGAPGRVDTLAAAQGTLWQSLDARAGQEALWPSNPMSAPVRTSLQGGQGMGPSFDSAERAEGVLIRDPRVEPLLSLQRPMVIDPPPRSFAEPGVPHGARISTP